MPDALHFREINPSECDSLLWNLLSAADFLRQIKLLHGPEELTQHPLLSSSQSLIAALCSAPSLSPWHAGEWVLGHIGVATENRLLQRSLEGLREDGWNTAAKHPLARDSLLGLKCMDSISCIRYWFRWTFFALSNNPIAIHQVCYLWMAYSVPFFLQPLTNNVAFFICFPNQRGKSCLCRLIYLRKCGAASCFLRFRALLDCLFCVNFWGNEWEKEMEDKRDILGSCLAISEIIWGLSPTGARVTLPIIIYDLFAFTSKEGRNVQGDSASYFPMPSCGTPVDEKRYWERILWRLCIGSWCTRALTPHLSFGRKNFGERTFSFQNGCYKAFHENCNQCWEFFFPKAFRYNFFSSYITIRWMY